jgi:hypothetical protein
MHRIGSAQSALKGQCHEIFCFRFFSCIIFPQAPKNNTRVISNFFENSWRYSQGQIFQQYQRHWRQIVGTRSADAVDTGGKFATDVNDTYGKFATGFKDTSGKQWEQCQAADDLK